MSQAQQLISDVGGRAPHVAVLASAGMGHVTPSIRLAVALASHGCLVTFITPRPTVSDAEARHISELHSAFPHIKQLDLDLLPLDASTVPAVDPFLLQFESIRRSAILLAPLLASVTPPLSAVLTDVSLISDVLPVTASLRLPNYVTFISCSMMLALCCLSPMFRRATGGGVPAVEIAGVGTLPGSWIPPALHDPGHLFTTQFVENGLALPQADGILINTFAALEGETLAALNAGAVVAGLPPVIAIGPQEAVPLGASRPGGERRGWAEWLDAQPPRSVVYVAFGNRTALSEDQIRELGVGLERSGCRFLWVVKSKVVDREEDAEAGLEELLGEAYRERVGKRGMVVKDWVEQEELLAHGSVGGFLSHGGWNSVAEAALHGVRVLAWPGGGDQRVNAAVAEKSGLGVWVKEWGWSSGREQSGVVRGEEIGQRLRELMGDAALGMSVARIRDEAVRAVGAGGSSYEALREFVAKLQKKGNAAEEKSCSY